jgi:hypothetical protein
MVQVTFTGLAPSWRGKPGTVRIEGTWNRRDFNFLIKYYTTDGGFVKPDK